jgi:hypothetical protein
VQAYQEREIVQGNKAMQNGRRWCIAKVLYLVRTAEHELGEAYMIEFLDGSRGAFDLNHIRRKA